MIVLNYMTQLLPMSLEKRVNKASGSRKQFVFVISEKQEMK